MINILFHSDMKSDTYSDGNITIPQLKHTPLQVNCYKYNQQNIHILKYSLCRIYCELLVSSCCNWLTLSYFDS